MLLIIYVDTHNNIEAHRNVIEISVMKVFSIYTFDFTIGQLLMHEENAKGGEAATESVVKRLEKKIRERPNPDLHQKLQIGQLGV